MLRADYDRYQESLVAQRADCLTRANYLRTHTAALARSATRVTYIDDTDSRIEWERTWRDRVRQKDREAQQLRLDEPTHYPKTDLALLALEAQLSEVQAAIEDAARYRDMHNKAGSGLLELAQDIAHAEGVARYYKRIGAEGIYLLIMEDLAMLESRYKDRLRERKRLSDDMNYSLARADRLDRDIRRELDHLDDHLQADEQRTYRQELKDRFGQFNLREELKGLLRGAA